MRKQRGLEARLCQLARVEMRTWVLSGVVWITASVLAQGQQGPARKVNLPGSSAPGRTILIRVVGPDGKPLVGVIANNLEKTGSVGSKPSDSAELAAIAPPAGKTRLVWLVHEAKKLAGALKLSNEVRGPHTVKLAPWAVITGNVVGEDKKPRAGLVCVAQGGDQTPANDVDNCAYWRVTTGRDGSFRIQGIVPGMFARLVILDQAVPVAQSGPSLTAKPGESIALGYVVFRNANLPAAAKRVAQSAPAPRPLERANFDESKANSEYQVDFRKGQYDLRRLKIDAPGGASRLVKPDKAGLRFTVPNRLGQGVTVLTKFGVAGDFEITASFEAVSRERPSTGWGMGPELYVKPPGGWEKFASAGRFLRTDATVYSLVHGYKAGNEQKYDAGTIPTESKTGRFRLVRTGPTLHYQVAEGESKPFRELFATEFGTEPLEFVRLGAVTGGSQKAVEILWKDLQVRAESLPGFSGPERDTGQPWATMARALAAVACVVAVPLIVRLWSAKCRKQAGSPVRGLAKATGARPRKPKGVPELVEKGRSPDPLIGPRRPERGR
jgi:hypothetical protein